MPNIGQGTTVKSPPPAPPILDDEDQMDVDVQPQAAVAQGGPADGDQMELDGPGGAPQVPQAAVLANDPEPMHPVVDRGNKNLSIEDLVLLVDNGTPDEQARAQQFLDAFYPLVQDFQNYVNTFPPNSQTKPVFRAYLNTFMNGGTTLQQIRRALSGSVKQLPAGHPLRQSVKGLTDALDTTFTWPGARTQGGLGDLTVGKDNSGNFLITGRPSWSIGVNDTVEAVTGQDRRHVTAWHTLRDGFEGILNSDQGDNFRQAIGE
ncbi:MAG: hypothetical protein AAFN74_11260 [Myxococcota bacterium]